MARKGMPKSPSSNCKREFLQASLKPQCVEGLSSMGYKSLEVKLCTGWSLPTQKSSMTCHIIAEQLVSLCHPQGNHGRVLHSSRNYYQEHCHTFVFRSYCGFIFLTDKRSITIASQSTSSGHLNYSSMSSVVLAWWTI